MSETLLTADEVIEFFGGTVQMANWAGTSMNAVVWWRKRGIPPAMHLRLLIETHRRGVRIGREVFQLTQEEWDTLYAAMVNQGLSEQGSCAA
ncbi:MAG: hypothetical protein ACR2PG_06350 [Hyphomicrobiaceae bacterium]